MQRQDVTPTPPPSLNPFAGTRLKPPDEFIDDGLVHFPPPTFKHENSHPYPHLQSPQYKEDRAITFVGEPSPSPRRFPVDSRAPLPPPPPPALQPASLGMTK